MLVDKICGYGKEITRKIYPTEKGSLERFSVYQNKKYQYHILVNNSEQKLEEQISRYYYTGTNVIKRFKNGQLFSKTVIPGEGNKNAKSGFYHSRFFDNGNVKVDTYLDKNM